MTDNQALGAAAIVAVLYIFREKLAGFVSAAAGGAIQSTLAVFGVPETDATQCQKDIAAGKWLDASFSCPAPEFIKNAYIALTKSGKTFATPETLAEEMQALGVPYTQQMDDAARILMWDSQIYPGTYD